MVTETTNKYTMNTFINVFSAGMKLIQFVSRYCFFVLLEHAARACLQGFSGW